MIARRNGYHARSLLSALTLVIAGTWSVPALAGPGSKARANDAADVEGDAAPKKGTKAAKPSRKHTKAPPKEAAHAKADPYDQEEAELAADPSDGDAQEAPPSDAEDAPDAKKDDKKTDAAKAHDEPHRARSAHAGKPALSKKGKKASRSKNASGAAPKGKKTKKTASRGGAKKKPPKKGEPKAPQKPCLGSPIAVDRNGAEAERVALVDCDGNPRPAARDRISVLARPWGVGRPAMGAARRDRAEPGGGRGAADDEIAPGVARLDAGLLTRLNAIARRFPGKTLSIVSGYRPQSRGSLHQSGRAVDLRVGDVENLEVVGFCRTLADTGCGFYPNSSFFHVDVRPAGTGVVHWIDASGPGEAPRYVTAWPPPPGELPPTDAPPSASATTPPARELSGRGASRNAPPPRGTKRPARAAATPGDGDLLPELGTPPGLGDEPRPEEPDSAPDPEEGAPAPDGAVDEPPFGLRTRAGPTRRGPSLLPAWGTARRP